MRLPAYACELSGAGFSGVLHASNDVPVVGTRAKRRTYPHGFQRRDVLLRYDTADYHGDVA